MVTTETAMAGPALLAHGGTGGLVLEILFLLLPFLVFGFMAWWTGRKRRNQAAARTDS